MIVEYESWDDCSDAEDQDNRYRWNSNLYLHIVQGIGSLAAQVKSVQAWLRRAYLSSTRGKPKIDEDEANLKDDSYAIDGDQREIFPLVAHNWQAIPSIKETIQQRNDE